MRRSLSFLHRLWSLPTRPRTIVRRQPRPRLGLEILEDRLVPANVLTISGDQLAPNFNDHITINATSNGGLMVTLNGQTTTYNPGQFSSVSVNAGGGSNAIDILGTPSGVSINVDSVGIDKVTVGNASNSVASHGSMSNIKGGVNVYGTGAVTLNVDDSGDSHGQAVSLKNGAIYYGTAAAVSFSPTYSGVNNNSTGVNIYGGSGSNTFNVYDTSFGSSFVDSLNTGVGNDTVNVYSITEGFWTFAAGGGKDNINLGLGFTGNLGGSTTIVQGTASTSLNIDDSLDSQARTVTIAQYGVEGLNAAGISIAGVGSVQVDGGSGGNTINVKATSQYTHLKTGTGNDTVNIFATTSALDVENPGGTDFVNVGLGNMGSIKGNVHVFGAGTTLLGVDDSNDTTARTVTMNDGSISGFGGTGIIQWTPSSASAGGVIGLAVNGGSGGNTFNVVNTSNFNLRTFLNPGTGNDTVRIHATKGTFFDSNSGGADITDVGLGSVANINGAIDIGGTGSTSLIVDDHLDSVSRTVTLTSSQLTGLGNAGIINYDSNSTGLGTDVTALTIDGSSIGSTYNIQSTATSIPVTVNGGSGNDTFNLGSGNSLNGIQGAVTIHGGGGTNILNAIDASSASGQSYTLSATQLTRSGIAAITYASLAAIHATASGNDTLTLLNPVPTVATTFNGGSGTNTLHGANVNNTWTISGPNSGTLDSVSFSNFQNLFGGNANDTFKFTASTAHIATVNGGGGDTNTLDYSALGSAFALTVNLETGSVPLITNGLSSSINAVAGSSDTANTLIGGNTAELWTLTAANTGTVTNDSLIHPFFTGAVNSLAFTAIPHLIGGTGVDDFKFANTSATVLSINGGGAPVHQGDWLDYSSLPSTSTVTVNLATGSATNVNGGVAGAVTGIQNVIGSASGTNNLTGNSHGNILIGGSGTNTLIGGSGNSLLIGGSGHGSITGGVGQDILIAGTTTYNATTLIGQTSLMAILAELQSTDTFAQKVSDIINGNNVGGGSDLNGGAQLTWGVTGATVGASTGAFKLSGDASAASTADWFFSGATSTVNDFNDDHVSDEHNNNAIGVF